MFSELNVYIYYNTCLIIFFLFLFVLSDQIISSSSDELSSLDESTSEGDSVEEVDTSPSVDVSNENEEVEDDGDGT